MLLFIVAPVIEYEILSISSAFYINSSMTIPMIVLKLTITLLDIHEARIH